MSDRSDEYRKAAAKCVALARATADPVTRVKLLTMAGKWLRMAEGSQINFDAVLKVFNDRQMHGH